MRTALLSIVILLTARCLAGEPQVFDLGNGAEIIVKDGRVEVRDRPGAAAGRSSNNVSTSSDGNGTTATVTSEREGQRVTRTIHISPDGKVTVDGQAAAPAAPPAVRAGAWMGVRSAPVSEALRAQIEIPAGQGVVLEVVAPGGPAARAGLVVNDILLTLNGAPVPDVDAFRATLRAARPQQQMAVTYLRKGKQGQATVTLDAPPAPLSAAAPAGDTPATQMLREMQERMAAARASGKTTVVGPDGKTKTAAGGDAFDLLLNDPCVPESMKEQIRRARDAHQPPPAPPPGPQ